MQLYVRYNAQEGLYSKEVSEAFAAYLVDGPSLEYYQNAFSDLLLETRKKYLIDPHTFHIMEEKKSHDKYLNTLGIGDKLSKINSDKRIRKEVTNKIIEYQKDKINQVLSENALEESVPLFQPDILIAPYCIISEGDDETINLNKEMLLDAKDIEPEKKIYTTIMLSKDLLTDLNTITSICDAYKESPCDGFCFAASNFSDQSDAMEYLRGYKHLVSELTKLKKPMISLYGGFLDILMKNNYSQAVVHGLDSGDKLTIASGSFGRRQSKRFYVYNLKRRFAGAELDLIKKVAPELLECRCKHCESGSEQEKIWFVKHYITMRANEIAEANKGVDQLEQINEAYEKYAPKLRYAINIDYLKRWYDLLKEK